MRSSPVRWLGSVGLAEEEGNQIIRFRGPEGLYYYAAAVVACLPGGVRKQGRLKLMMANCLLIYGWNMGNERQARKLHHRVRPPLCLDRCLYIWFVIQSMGNPGDLRGH